MKNTGFSNSRENWRGGSRNKLLTGSNSTSNNTTSSTATTNNASSGGRTASFLANLNPVRWGRCNSSSSTPPHHLHNTNKVRRQAMHAICTSFFLLIIEEIYFK